MRGCGGRRALLLVALAGACRVGPSYETKDPASPAAWSVDGGARVSAGTPELDAWWRVFDDPALASLVARAVRANHDARIAETRVREVRARYRLADADRKPRVDATAAAGRERRSENGAVAFGLPAGADAEHALYAVGFDAAWELDLFGGLRREAEAAAADVGAATEARRAVLVTLLGDVARAYMEARGARAQLAALRANVAAATTTLELTRSRADGGVATALDVARAEAQRDAARSLVPEREAAFRRATNRLATLLGESSAALAAELSGAEGVPAPPPTVLVGIPSELLRRRPDLRRRERELAAACARVGVATAELYPRLSLTGAFGLESVDAGDLLDGASRAWRVGPSLRWPLLQFGRIRARIAVADARAERAAIAYEQARLLAVEEVENALVAYLREWERRETLAAALEARRSAAALARDLHASGLATFLDVLDAERELFDAERLLAESDTARAVHLVALFKALGGGWRAAEDAAETTVPG